MAGLYIITGSNGAGKSSFGASYLPEKLQGYNVFDGDKLFMQKRRRLSLHKHLLTKKQAVLH